MWSLKSAVVHLRERDQSEGKMETGEKQGKIDRQEENVGTEYVSTLLWVF